jgi:hypothetical protein
MRSIDVTAAATAAAVDGRGSVEDGCVAPVALPHRRELARTTTWMRKKQREGKDIRALSERIAVFAGDADERREAATHAGWIWKQCVH